MLFICLAPYYQDSKSHPEWNVCINSIQSYPEITPKRPQGRQKGFWVKIGPIPNGKWLPKGAGVITDATLTTKQKYEDIEITTNQSKEGTQYQITSTTSNEVIGEKIVSADKIPFMRKRQIEITASGLKPSYSSSSSSVPISGCSVSLTYQL